MERIELKWSVAPSHNPQKAWLVDYACKKVSPLLSVTAADRLARLHNQAVSYLEQVSAPGPVERSAEVEAAQATWRPGDPDSVSLPSPALDYLRGYKGHYFYVDQQGRVSAFNNIPAPQELQKRLAAPEASQ